MKLFLVQHGEAKTEAEDPERPLTERGAEAAKKVAVWVARADLKVDEIRHSGKRRAQETATILAEYLHPAKGVVSVSGLKPNDDVRPTTEAIHSQGGSLMLVGHLPFLDRLANLLVTGNPETTVIRFHNAGIVCLVEEDGRWSVSWAVTPELLN